MTVEVINNSTSQVIEVYNFSTSTSGVSKSYVDSADNALGVRIDNIPVADVTKSYVDSADVALFQFLNGSIKSRHILRCNFVVS